MTAGEALPARDRVLAIDGLARLLAVLRDDGYQLFYRNLEHPRWDEVATRCLSCANCMLACSTCFCTSVEDMTDLAGDTAERWRRWDSCFTLDHSYVHGGSVRATTRSRYRQWLVHNLASWLDQVGTSGCVGCGRCITWCPVGIDLTEEAAAIRATPRAAEAAEQLRAEGERLRTRWPALRVTTRLELGIADEILTKLAERDELRARLVVVSSLGRRAPARWLLGSVAERTAQTSPVPVLVVRDPRPFTAWLNRGRRLRVVVGFDFSATATAALGWASELGRVAPCDVVVAHVTWPREERKRLGAHWAVPASEVFPQLEPLLQNDLRARIQEHAWPSGPPKIRIALVARGRGDALAQLAADEQADLLVVGTRQLHGPNRLWSETVSRGALYHAAMSVACVPVVAPRGERADVADEVEEEADLATQLEAHPFLRGVSGDLLRRLASISREAQLPAGAMILREGADADTVFLLQSGRVALELAVPGKGTVQLESLQGGDLLGLSWLFPPYRWRFDARVVEPVVALAIDASKLRAWMTEDTALGQVVAMRLVSQLYERLQRVRMQRLDFYRAEP